jgi:hypothetical protein
LTKQDRLQRLECATAERELSMTDKQVRLLERFSSEFCERHIEAPHTGAPVAVDIFFAAVLKGVGKSLPSGLLEGLRADRDRLFQPLRLCAPLCQQAAAHRGATSQQRCTAQLRAT